MKRRKPILSLIFLLILCVVLQSAAFADGSLLSNADFSLPELPEGWDTVAYEAENYSVYTQNGALVIASAAENDVRVCQMVQVEPNTVYRLSAEISADDLVVRREEKPGLVAASEGGVTIALATELTRELEEEGFARELVSRIQGLRRDLMLEVTDRIRLGIQVPAEWSSAVEHHRDYICGETLAVALDCAPGGALQELEINGSACGVSVEKA